MWRSGIRCEVGDHALRQLFDSPDTEAALFIDASNAFTSLNQQIMLHNIQHLCPSLLPFLLTVTLLMSLCIIDGETIFSQKGITQGDPPLCIGCCTTNI